MAGAATTPHTVAVLEDDPDSGDIFRTILEHFGYRVLQAGDGFAGTEMVRRKFPDLVLLDLGLPGIDGWEVLRVLKRDARTRRVPVIVVTAQEGEETRARALGMGCVDYLTKPVLPLHLVQAVEQCIGEGVGLGGSPAS